MSSKLFACRDVETGDTEYLDLKTGKVFKDAEGATFDRQLHETEWLLGEKGQPVLDEHGDRIHLSKLSNFAAQHMYGKAADVSGTPIDIKMRDEVGNLEQFRCHGQKSNRVFARDQNGKLFVMDLAPGDVHTASTWPAYIGGYQIEDGIADMMSPVVLVPKDRDVFYTADSKNDFSRKIPNQSASGAAVPEVNPTYSPTTFATVPYALGGFLPTEIQAAADAPIQPFQKLSQMIVDGLRLEREIRVAALMTLTGSWNSNNVTTIAANAQWNGGANSDPITNLKHAIQQSLRPVTGIGWNQVIEDDFTLNSNVQKFLAQKDRVPGIPAAQQISAEFRLPPIYTSRMKYTSSGAPTYVWGNDVVLIHQPSTTLPRSQMEIITSLTLRWMAGDSPDAKGAPDGAVTAGMLLRSFYDPDRGARGGTKVVCAHNDIELMMSALVGGVLKNAHQ